MKRASPKEVPPAEYKCLGLPIANNSHQLRRAKTQPNGTTMLLLTAASCSLLLLSALMMGWPSTFNHQKIVWARMS